MNDSSPQPRTSAEEIAGLVEQVTFFNEDSGFAVLRVKVRGQRELVTVLGSVPAVSAGERLTAKGWWVRDKEDGLQFKATALKATPPNTSEGVERYLAGGCVDDRLHRGAMHRRRAGRAVPETRSRKPRRLGLGHTRQLRPGADDDGRIAHLRPGRRTRRSAADQQPVLPDRLHQVADVPGRRRQPGQSRPGAASGR